VSVDTVPDGEGADGTPDAPGCVTHGRVNRVMSLTTCRRTHKQAPLVWLAISVFSGTRVPDTVHQTLTKEWGS